MSGNSDERLFVPDDVREIDELLGRIEREMGRVETEPRADLIARYMPEGLVRRAKEEGLLGEVHFELVRMHLNSLADLREDGTLGEGVIEEARRRLNDWRASLPHEMRERVTDIISTSFNC